MQKMRNAADLLQGCFDRAASFDSPSIGRVKTIDEKLHESQFLAQAVMQLARDAAAFVILRGDHPGGNALHVRIEHLELARFAVEIRSEERRVGKEGRCGWWGDVEKEESKDSDVSG